MYTPDKITGILGSPVIPHTLLLTLNEHITPSASVGRGRPVQVADVALVVGGQTPQSDEMT